MPSGTPLDLAVCLRRFREKNGDRFCYDRVKWVNSQTKVEVLCKEHGITFFVRPDCHWNRGLGCVSCISVKNRACLRAHFVNAARETHGTRYDYSKTVYVNCSSKVIITCPTHGDFEQIPDNHVQGSHCSKCMQGPHLTTAQWVALATKFHNGRYGYDHVNYRGTKETVIIVCPVHGHFSKRPSEHLKGVGCPTCSTKARVSERVVRETMQRVVGQEMPTARPAWLQGLELDGYSNELKLGFEYQGHQHYMYMPQLFHQKGEFQFHNQQKRDATKVALCAQNNVRLIVIDGRKYSQRDTAKLEEHVLARLAELGYVSTVN